MEPRFKPTAVKAPHGATTLEITWGDGHRSLLPHEILRGYCPCATCQGHSGTLKFQAGGDQRIRELSQVGNYALSFSWGDGHDSGIYSFRYLRSLADLVETQGAEAVKSLGELPRL